ncbi:unnamed protein product [Nezara viridula]|uniref:Uncharacterized protein n=1 Tax=Nezara viridula TaxID=85310 RepID=A0A9P0H5V5_NEZVI|nr:unnamed protein product [Nezara viridula]
MKDKVAMLKAHQIHSSTCSFLGIHTYNLKMIQAIIIRERNYSFLNLINTCY